MQLACRQPTYRKRNVAVYAPPSVVEATERHVYIRIHGINGWRHMATYLGEKYKSGTIKANPTTSKKTDSLIAPVSQLRNLDESAATHWKGCICDYTFSELLLSS